MSSTILVRSLGPLNVFITRPKGHLLGGKVSSETKTISLTSTFLQFFDHLLRCNKDCKYSEDHVLHQSCNMAWTNWYLCLGVMFCQDNWVRVLCKNWTVSRVMTEIKFDDLKDCQSKVLGALAKKLG